jgi:hypothetical protein
MGSSRNMKFSMRQKCRYRVLGKDFCCECGEELFVGDNVHLQKNSRGANKVWHRSCYERTFPLQRKRMKCRV